MNEGVRKSLELPGWDKNEVEAEVKFKEEEIYPALFWGPLEVTGRRVKPEKGFLQAALIAQASERGSSVT